jgi:hypothetical protein
VIEKGEKFDAAENLLIYTEKKAERRKKKKKKKNKQKQTPQKKI